jgi:hypothetical protein
VLSVIAYDDREILLDGKKVVGPEGGTYRRTREMTHLFSRTIALDSLEQGPFVMYTGLSGRVEFCIHQNPANEILHTRLVGEMNGFLHAMTLGSSAAIPIKGPEIYGTFISE